MGIESRKKGQDSQKSHKLVVLTETKIYLLGNLFEVIVQTKFQNEIFDGYNFTWR